MTDQLDPAKIAERIEEVLDRLDPRTRPAGEEVVRLLMRFYGAGLEQAVGIARAAAGDQLVQRLAADPLVGSLLALHDLHPVPLRTRVEHAMSVAARKLGSHASDATLLGIDDDGTVRVEVPAAGCGATTVREVVAEEVTAAAPDSAGVTFVERQAGPTLLQIGVRGKMTGLRRFLVDDPAPAEVQERCELCATPVPPEHPHLVQTAERRLLCACGPCGFLFDNPGAGGGGYARVPDRYLSDPAFTLSDTQWDALQIPVGMAFFLHNSVRGAIVACYPSPAGATESELTLDAWAGDPGDGGVGASSLAAQLQPDVEALLVRREPRECLLVPIDACYRLVGLVRLHWRGFDGGSEAWAAIDAFFAELHTRTRQLEGGR